MLLKIRPKLVIILILILFLAVKCKGSSGDWGYGDFGYSHLTEEPPFAGGSTSEIVAEDEGVHGETNAIAQRYADDRDDLNVSDAVYRICKDVKRYFQKKEKAANKLCEEFIKSWEEFLLITRLGNAFTTNKEKGVEETINALREHREKGSSEVHYEGTVFAAETAATSSGYMPMTEYHEKKKGWGIGAIVKAKQSLKKWAKKIKAGKSSGSGEKGKTLRLGGK
uniref:Uncharacterized protein n=1 Tax=Meloidogyne javanica TaxID=6303 RepID=A0A915MG86_MELJA